MIKDSLYFIFAFLISCGIGLSAQQAHEIDTIYPVHSLDHILQVYPDSLDVLTPEIVLERLPTEFLKGDQLPRLLQIGMTYWGKVKIVAKQPLKGWTLHLEDKMIGPPAWTKSNGKVDVYAYDDKGDLIFHQTTGAEYPEHERNYKGHWVMNAVNLEDLAVDMPITLVLKLIIS